MTNIFKSKFTLQFKSPNIQSIYEKMSNKNMRKYNITYSLINLILAIPQCLIYALTFQERKDIFYIYIKYTAFILTSIQGVYLILSILIRNIAFQKWISYVNICIFFVISMTLRIYIGNFANLDYLILNMVYFTQQIYFMAWFFTHSIDFYDGFWVYLSTSIIAFGILGPTHPIALDFRFLIAAYIMMINSLISYFYVHEKKKAFYYNFINETTIKSYRSIIENMNSGFINIKNSRIVSWNKTLFHHLKKINDKKEEINNNNILNEDAMIEENNIITDYSSLEAGKTKSLLNELFEGIVIDSLIRPVEDLTDFQKTLNFVKNYQNIESDENFIFIGTKVFQYDKKRETSQYFEIFGRCCDRFKEEQEENYEFIFNDVSKTKIAEKIKAEIKYKTLFLSKVAHEFKNPLLCVSELIDQLRDEMQINTNSYKHSNPNSKVKDYFHQIKSMCEYLLILVKDFDFFSIKSTESANKIILNKENVKLARITNYCDDITNVLLKKFEKEDSIMFHIDCPQEIYHREIFTDEVRLKQLLINLLSNSVKYTFHGHITLQIKEDNGKIIFYVIDTGMGLTKEQITRLCTNLFDDRDLAAYSTGLGFSIIKEIINLFETQLHYELIEESGSKFSFSLDLVVNIRENSFSLLLSENSRLNSSGASESKTIVINNFSSMQNLNVLIDIQDQVKFKPIEKGDEIASLTVEANTDYYLVVDDEIFTRKSTTRVLNSYFASKLKNARNNVILEASDGIECLNVFYQCMKKGIKLSFIISDETMSILNGEACAKILNQIIAKNYLRRIPYFILTAYESMDFDKECIYKSFTKPLASKNVEEILLLSSKLLS